MSVYQKNETNWSNDDEWNTEQQVTIEALPNGGYVIAWVDGNAGDNNIRAQIFDAGGFAVGSEFIVNGVGPTGYDVKFNIDIQVLDSGDFVIAWDQTYAGTNGNGILAKVFTQAGTPLGNEFLAGTYDNEVISSAREPEIVAAEDGTFWVLSLGGLPYSPAEVYAQKFDSSGTLLVDRIALSGATDLCEVTDVVTAKLGNGNIAVAWTEHHNDGSYTLVQQVFDAAFAPVSASRVIDSFSQFNGQPFFSIAQFTGGGFAVLWSDNDLAEGDSVYSVYLQAFDNAGDESASRVLIDETAYNNNYLDLTSLADGTVLAAWSPADGTEVLGQIIDSAGTAAGSLFPISTSAGAGLHGLAASGLAGGGFAIGSVGSPDGRAEGGVYSTSFSLQPQGGTVGDDVIVLQDHMAVVDALAGNDYIYGTALANSLIGGLGDDTMIGLAGNDTYSVDSSGDVVTEAAGHGTDTVMAAISQTLGANLENLILTGSAAIDATGNSLSNVLTGNTGDNVLSGGLGNDTYIVQNIGDNVVEANGQGTDMIFSSVAYSLGDRFVEFLTLTGSTNIDAVGNSLSNKLTGNDGNNILDGAGGTDTLTGGLGDDTYYVYATGDRIVELASEGQDVIYSSVGYGLAGIHAERLVLTGSAHLNATGNSLSNDLIGNAGNNILDGGAGLDTLTGSAGNDTYVVNITGDVVVEESGGGVDLVQSLASYTISTHVERLELMGTANLAGTGNDLNNTLTGNSGNNSLDGSAGADTMIGGLGNDTYSIDQVGDRITEVSGGGVDWAYSSVSYSLAGTVVENLTLSGAGNLNATGNGVGNKLTGNSGNNVLDGAAGSDTLAGGLGDDTYFVQSVGDKVVENSGEGFDTILATVTYTLTGRFAEVLQLTGSANIDASGNSVSNALTGNAGNNILNGLGGNDTLTGGAGEDTFLFQVGCRADLVTDFSASQGDMININAYTGGVANASLVSQIGGDVVITLGGGNSVTLVNTTYLDALNHMVW